VLRARRKLAPWLRPTPLRRSFAVPGQAPWLKLECWQPTGSFKVRGATNVLASLDPRTSSVVAASAGNHALGVAFAAQALGGRVSATLFVPETAPRAKVEKLQSFPITLRQVGATYDDAFDAAQAFVAETGAAYIHAFEDPLTAAGQGTLALEILDELPDVGDVLVPVGGGGLIAAVATVLKQMRPDVRIIALQPEASPALRESLRQGVPLLRFANEPTLADGIAGGIGQIVFDHRHLIDDVVTVSEAEIEDAILALLSEDQVVAEASAVLGIAALRAGRVSARPGRPQVAVITGSNIDMRVLARLLARTASVS
jgi:threonine dehydratase